MVIQTYAKKVLKNICTSSGLHKFKSSYLRILLEIGETYVFSIPCFVTLWNSYYPSLMYSSYSIYRAINALSNGVSFTYRPFILLLLYCVITENFTCGRNYPTEGGIARRYGTLQVYIWRQASTIKFNYYFFHLNSLKEKIPLFSSVTVLLSILTGATNQDFFLADSVWKFDSLNFQSTERSRFRR